MKKEKTFTFVDITIIVILTALIMYVLGGILVYRHLGGVNYSLLADDNNLQEFISAYNGLLENYYDDLDKTALIEGAINGMYSTVDDPYTNYMDEKNTTSLNDSLSGTYQGIGIRIQMLENGDINIYEVFDNSPAEKAGLKKNDIITSVNGESVEAKMTAEIVDMIKSSGKSDVEITVRRGEETLTFKMNITDLTVPVVTSQILESDGKKIGYLSLSVFNDNGDRQIKEKLEKLESEGMDSLIIDLRNNTGGYLQTATNIAELFIEKDKIIYSLENKESKSDYKDKTDEKRNYKVAVLINKGSASASEILAAALKYSYGAILVGETSFGKGKVQERASLTSGTTVKYTTAKWLTPNGDCIDGIGLTPDYPVALETENYVKDDLYTDSQVLYTIECLVD